MDLSNLPSKKLIIFFVVSMDILDLHSFVKVAECGLSNTSLFFNRGLSLFMGSF